MIEFCPRCGCEYRFLFEDQYKRIAGCNNCVTIVSYDERDAGKSVKVFCAESVREEDE